MQPGEGFCGLLCMIDTIRIKEGSLVARLAAWKLGSSRVAMVVGDTIHLHNTSRQEFLSSDQWVRHELEHVRQFRKYGTMRFVAMYVWESLWNGYHHNRFEVEARQAERAKSDPFDLTKADGSLHHILRN